MKVAITSGSFDRQLAGGELTQLEWLEGCASELGADGVVFARAHFPRTDEDYVAQLRKVAVDLGLVPLAVADPSLLAPDTEPSARRATIELAAALGAIFVLTVLPAAGDVPPAAFVAAVSATKAAIGIAKSRNVTLLAGIEAGTLGADVPALRRFIKDVDSAWLRFALPAGADRRGMGKRDRALLVNVDAGSEFDAVAEIDEAARPWLLLAGDVCAQRVTDLRRAAARRLLAPDAAGS
jgi:sugar phosphate isomerase/epimerase